MLEAARNLVYRSTGMRYPAILGPLSMPSWHPMSPSNLLAAAHRPTNTGFPPASRPPLFPCSIRFSEPHAALLYPFHSHTVYPFHSRSGSLLCSHPLVQELAAALRSGLLGGRIEHLPPATAAARAGGEGASSTPTHTASAAPGVGVGVAPEPLPEEVMLVPGCAALHPVRFLLGLADAVVRRGGGRDGPGLGWAGVGQGEKKETAW